MAVSLPRRVWAGVARTYQLGFDFHAMSFAPSTGLYVYNDRQHGLGLLILDQQTLGVQFAPGPHLISVDVVVAGDPGNRGAGFKRLVDDRSFPFQWMPSVLTPCG